MWLASSSGSTASIRSPIVQNERGRPYWNNKKPEHKISVAMLSMTVTSACSARFSSLRSILAERIAPHLVHPAFIKMAAALIVPNVLAAVAPIVPPN
ncbi:MAG: hypothetical protein KGL35_02685 [Bradyrhizobium sp.]|nr:hypothetical protein [Bradyrhizobium sp.]